MDKVTRIAAQVGLLVGLYFAAANLSLAAKPAHAGKPADKGPNANSLSVVDAVLMDGSTSVLVTSTKELSNVVMMFCDMTLEKVEVFTGSRQQELVEGLWTATLSGAGENDGAGIAAVWVKSGSFRSGDGPGYGEKITFEEACGGGAGGAGDGGDGGDGGNDGGSGGPFTGG